MVVPIKMRLFEERSDMIMLMVIAIVISIGLTDTMINQVSDFLSSELISDFGIATFCISAIILGISQFIILRYVDRKISYLRSKSSSVKSMHRIVVIIQYVLLVIISVLIIQIVITSQYSTYTLFALTAISYSLNIVLMSYFAKKLLSWYRANRDSIVVLLYGISFVLIAATSLIGVTMDLYNLSLKPAIIHPSTEVVFPTFEEDSPIFILHVLFRYFDLFSFLLVWVSTVLLLHGYMRKWQARNWILLCLPLVYYLSTLIEYLGLFTPSSDPEWFSYYLYSSLYSTAGGILFGFAFLIVARNVHNDMIRGFMVISAYGFILLFISSQVTLVATSFPPYGTATISYFGLSSYLILIGLYATALSVSQDLALRKSIRKSLMDKSKLLGGIGSAEMQIETEKWVRNIGKRDYKTNIPPSMTENDVRAYIKDIVEEIKSRRR
jgi:hypothetical protein